MKKTRNVMIFLLALTILSGMVLAGCGSAPAATTQPAAGNTATAASGATNAPTTAALEPATLTYWITGPNKQKDSDTVWAAVNKLLAEKLPNTTVEFNVVSPGEYADKWARALAAQEKIDVAWLGWMINVLDEANKGSVMPLDDLLVANGKDLVAALGEDVINVHRLPDGHIYQIPCWQGLVGGRYGIFFPKELSDLAGSSFIKDFQDLMYANWDKPTAEAKSKAFDMMETYLKATKDAGKLAKGYNVHTLYTWWLLNGIARISNTGNSTVSGEYAYVEYGDDGFTVKSTQESDFIKMNYQYVAKWFDAGYIRSDIASLEAVSGGADEWRVDKAWANSYNVTAHNAFTDTIGSQLTTECGFDVAVAFTNPTCEYTLGTATGTGIPTTSKNPERAMMLMNLLYSDAGKDIYQTYVYGIKDTHWTDNGDGTVKTLSGDGQATDEWAYGNWKWVIGSCMNALVTQADAKGYYEELKSLESTARVNPIIGFKFDNTPVESIKAQLDAITGEYISMLYRGYLGSGWEAKYNEYIQKMKDAGLDQYLAEVQKQLADYVAKTKVKW